MSGIDMTGLSCSICGEDSGTRLVCESCRTRMSPSQQKRVTIAWHNVICEAARDPLSGLYICFHCQMPFERNRVCGDHFPDTKAAAPELRYDVTAGKCSCAGCNTSGASTRTRVQKKLCTKCRIRLPLSDNLCVVCR